MRSMVTSFESVCYGEDAQDEMLTTSALGPNEVSVIDPQVVDLVHGSKSKCQKAAMYDISQPLTTLQQFRDRPTHDRRRRGGWDLAFSTKCKHVAS